MVEIRLLRPQDIQPIATAFAEIGWDKPAMQFEGYLHEQNTGKRQVLVATVDEHFAGYLTLVWESGYLPFYEASIPEIVDFNVLPKFRRRGIGTQLMDEAERQIAERSSTAGIGVGLTKDYGAAHILYIRRGYFPDGRGINWNGNICQYGDRVIVDDGLAIFFTKQLK
jgi:GNAT superfamily N-acetyltransferase